LQRAVAVACPWLVVRIETLASDNSPTTIIVNKTISDSVTTNANPNAGNLLWGWRPLQEPVVGPQGGGKGVAGEKGLEWRENRNHEAKQGLGPAESCRKTVDFVKSMAENLRHKIAVQPALPRSFVGKFPVAGSAGAVGFSASSVKT